MYIDSLIYSFIFIDYIFVSFAKYNHTSLVFDRLDMVLLLLQFGADPFQCDSRGRTAFDCTRCSEFRHKMRLLRAEVKVKGVESELS